MIDLIEASDLDADTSLTDEWRQRMKRLNLESPLDVKAADAAVAYFADKPRSIKGSAERLGVKRDTALRRLIRADRNGWVTLYGVPMAAGEVTLSRVVGRNVFWPEGMTPWDGDTSRPAF